MANFLESTLHPLHQLKDFVKLCVTSVHQVICVINLYTQLYPYATTTTHNRKNGNVEKRSAWFCIEVILHIESAHTSLFICQHTQHTNLY